MLGGERRPGVGIGGRLFRLGRTLRGGCSLFGGCWSTCLLGCGGGVAMSWLGCDLKERFLAGFLL